MRVDWTQNQTRNLVNVCLFIFASAIILARQFPAKWPFTQNFYTLQVERIAQMSEENSVAAKSTAQTSTDMDAVAKDMYAEIERYSV